MAIGSNMGGGLRRGRRPRKLVVPDVSGLLLRDAQIVLTQAGFQKGVPRYMEDYAAPDSVVSQTPLRGQLVDSDTPILLGVSKQNWVRFLPQVFQLAAGDGEDLLHQLLFIFQQIHESVTLKIDNIHNLMRPLDAPPEFLPWLASWIALQL